MPSPFVVQPRTPVVVKPRTPTTEEERSFAPSPIRREGEGSAGRGRPGAPQRWVPAPAVRATREDPSATLPARAPSTATPSHRAPVREAPAGEVPAPRHPVLAPFAALLDDPEVSDLFVNGSAGLFADRGAGPEPVATWRAAEEEVRDLAVALIGLGGRHIDDSTPCVDVRLDGGLRVHAVLPPVSTEGTVISIRVPRVARPILGDLEARGMFGPRTRELLEELVARRENILVTGAAGAGKTTLLSALLSAAPGHERIVTIEDVAELRLDHPHHVRLEARQPNLEGAGAIGLARLVREALRMRPDRLVVGECRGEEVRELLSALNTGHDGGAGTLHANGLADVPARLEALGALAGLDDLALARQAVSAIGRVLHVSRGPGGRRRLSEIGRPVLGDDGRLHVEELECPG
ncbi:TadA family conjugal transfer-associated ATPase [Microbacterium sp. Marseille-Q6648]|uniref:TadA family conjugal transfer-associated ATPase n=1 Tax=Microbacterium sp. Marseille-Q6648 TaxID=2937991 RepID=UPI00203FAC05|nr:TadA family conjugal transfer-associated ATPase [Microbacterium sp. Marseille-Q6648]